MIKNIIPSSPGKNDCFRSALAMLMGLPDKDGFPIYLGDDWAAKYRAVLATQGYGLIVFPVAPHSILATLEYLNADGPNDFILHINSKRTNHAIVISNAGDKTIVVDPSATDAYEVEYDFDDFLVKVADSLGSIPAGPYPPTKEGLYYIVILTKRVES